MLQHATAQSSTPPFCSRQIRNKPFKLTAKTKYYQHTGNNNFYLESSKAKMKKLLSGKPADYGGDISFTVKNGKVTLLIAR